MTQKQNIGILLTNTGTPDDPSIPSVRRYLAEFLADPRIVHLPRALWLPILHGVVLRTRPRRSAKLYQKIWTDYGAPMRIYMEQIARKLQQQNWDDHNNTAYYVEVGMHYGKPSIASALANLKKRNVQQIIVLPLFPQYSTTTTASSFDRVCAALAQQWHMLPTLRFMNHYADDNLYTETIAAKLKQIRQQNKNNQRHLLISFHGLPKRYTHAGDPYESHCQMTAGLITKSLGLADEDWTLCYQSKFGFDRWLSPSTQVLFATLPSKGIKNIDVICPGFAVDCLETLEEIAITGKQIFADHGGEHFRYIPALNDSDEHIRLLRRMVESS